jgi:prophage maintenance system killer protein
LNGYNLTASQPEAYRAMMAIAAGAMTEDEFAGWIELNNSPR